MRAWLFGLLLFLVPQTAQAGSGGWHYRYDGWSGTCYAQVHNGRTTVGFMARPGGEVFAFVQGVNLPPSSYSTWQVKGQQWRRLVGGQDGNSGGMVYAGVTPRLLAEIAAGNRLDVFVHADGLSGNAPIIGTNDLSLHGSARSLARFQECYCNGWDAPAEWRLALIKVR